jgi:O-antigen ligase
MQFARWPLVVLLSGYLIFNKPFALLGIGPLYIGEMVLALLLVVSVLHFKTSLVEPLRRSWLSRITAAFFVYGALRVGFDAMQQSSAGMPHVMLVLRDGVCVGYALYALLAPAVLDAEALATVLICVAPLAALWTALTFFGIWPTDNAWIIAHRKADMHSLSAVVAAWVMGVFAYAQRVNRKPAGKSPRGLAPLWILAALLCTLLAAVMRTRAAWFAVACLIGALATLNYRRLLNRYAVALGLIVTALVVFVAIPYLNHSDSPWAERVRAVYSNDYQQMKTPEGVNAQLNVEWRRLFWAQCINQTLSRAPLTGLGFGINLTDLMRETPAEWWRYEESQRLDPPNRNPHNASITVFSRMGLIGLALWWTIVLGTAATAVSHLDARRRAGEDSSSAMILFGVWLIYAAYMSVGDVIENPFGGIWFWVLTGALQRLTIRAANVTSPARVAEESAVSV